MRYKGKLQPSHLLCPEVYSWHLLTDDIRKTLDNSKYSRLNPSPCAIDENGFDEANDLTNVRLIVDCKFLTTYGQCHKMVSDRFNSYFQLTVN